MNTFDRRVYVFVQAKPWEAVSLEGRFAPVTGEDATAFCPVGYVQFDQEVYDRIDILASLPQGEAQYFVTGMANQTGAGVVACAGILAADYEAALQVPGFEPFFDWSGRHGPEA